MSLWITVYCPETIEDVTPEGLMSLRDNDFWTLAEDYDIAEELVSPALKRLTIEKCPEGFQLNYRKAGERQLQIRCWTSPEQVTEEVCEAKALVGDSNPVISEKLLKATSVIGIELGSSQIDDMGIVFAYEVARWFGNHKQALIKGVDEDGLVVSGGGFAWL